jgi:flagellar FliL protein
MANTEVTSSEDVGTRESSARVSLMPLLVSTVVAVIVSVGVLGGAGFWMIKSGRLPLGKGATTGEVVKRPLPKTKLLALEPLLVNLSDPGGRSYLRVAITFRVDDLPPAKGAKPAEEKGKPVNENEAAMRDAALTVLGRQTGDALLAPEGKERLKTDLRSAMAEYVPEIKVDDVLFTEFLVQR